MKIFSVLRDVVELDDVVVGQRGKGLRRQGLIPVSDGDKIVLPADGLSLFTAIIDPEILHGYAEALLEIHWIRDVPAIGHEAVRGIEAAHSVRDVVHAAEGPGEIMVLPELVRPEIVGGAEIILRARIVQRRVCVTVDEHLHFAFTPAGPVVDFDAKRRPDIMALTADAINDRIDLLLGNGSRRAIGGVEIHCVFQKGLANSRYHPVERPAPLADVGHRDSAVFSEGHGPEAVQSLVGRHKHGYRVEDRKLTRVVLRHAIERKTEKGAEGRFHGRMLLAVPVDAENEIGAGIAAAPPATEFRRTLAIHNGGGFAGGD